MTRILENRTQLGGWPLRATVMIVGLSIVTGCASQPVAPKKMIHQSGLNTVWLEQDPDSTANTHPVTLTAKEVGTLLRGVRSWERRYMPASQTDAERFATRKSPSSLRPYQRHWPKPLPRNGPIST